MPGYLSPLYAQSFTDAAGIRELPACGGRLLERAIPGTGTHDAMGCYPLFSCARWDRLGEDLAEIGEELVTVSLVTDPLGDFLPEQLHGWFPDRCLPFKEHFLVDLSRDWEASIGRHHRRRLRSVPSTVEVETSTQPLDWLDDWCDLYAGLIERHAIQGIACFSREGFARQMCVPGIHAFRAVRGDEVIGMLLWYVQQDAAYYHLGAFSPTGYKLGASYALFRAALARFAAARLRWAMLGGAAGLSSDSDDGLARFKQGWANDSRTAWFCGRVCDPATYNMFVEDLNVSGQGFFPAYRSPETLEVHLPQRTQRDMERSRGESLEGARLRSDGEHPMVPHALRLSEFSAAKVIDG